MKKVKEIYYIDNREERSSDFSTGFMFILEDGSKVETMTTDTVAERYTKPEPYNCIRCNDNGCPACDGTKGNKYNPEPF